MQASRAEGDERRQLWELANLAVTCRNQPRPWSANRKVVLISIWELSVRSLRGESLESKICRPYATLERITVSFGRQGSWDIEKGVASSRFRCFHPLGWCFRGSLRDFNGRGGTVFLNCLVQGSKHWPQSGDDILNQFFAVAQLLECLRDLRQVFDGLVIGFAIGIGCHALVHSKRSVASRILNQSKVQCRLRPKSNG